MPTIRYKQGTSDKSVASNGTTAATVYTFGTGLLNPDGSTAGFGGIVDRIICYNSDTVQHDVQYSVGAAAADTIIARFTLPSLASVIIPGPFRGKDSVTLQIKLGEAHTSTAVYTKVEVSEFH